MMLIKDKNSIKFGHHVLTCSVETAKNLVIYSPLIQLNLGDVYNKLMFATGARLLPKGHEGRHMRASSSEGVPGAARFPTG